MGTLLGVSGVALAHLVFQSQFVSRGLEGIGIIAGRHLTTLGECDRLDTMDVNVSGNVHGRAG